MNKLQQKISSLCRNRASFPVTNIKWIMEAVFMSVLDYGDVTKRQAAFAIIKPLDSVYHSALHFITADVYGTHHCTPYERVGDSYLLGNTGIGTIFFHKDLIC